MDLKFRISIDKELECMYFWVKSVKGFDDTQHCAKCLVGDYLKIKKWGTSFQSASLDDVFYICIVSKPYVWKQNKHLAFRIDPSNDFSKHIEFEHNGSIIKISNVIKIDFEDMGRELAFKKYPERSKAYTTCRNFQFGVYLTNFLNYNSKN